MKKLRWVVLFLATSLFALKFYFDLKDKDANYILSVLGNLDVKYLILAIFLQIATYFVTALNTQYYRLKFQRLSYFYTLHSTYYGISIGALLPGFLSAGAVSEISIMNLQGLDVHKSASIALVRQIGYFIALAIVPTVAILCNLGYFTSHIEDKNWWVYVLFVLGFLINFATIFFYAFISKANNALYKIARVFVNFFAKIKIIRKKDELLKKIKHTLDSLKEQMSNLSFKWHDWLVAICASSLNMIVSNAVSYFCAFALHIDLRGKFWNMLACSGFITQVTGTLPIPSGLGIADAAYNPIMQPLVGAENVSFLHLFWRLVTFYLPIVISIVVMAFPIPRPKDKKDEQNSQDLSQDS